MIQSDSEKIDIAIDLIGFASVDAEKRHVSVKTHLSGVALIQPNWAENSFSLRTRWNWAALM